MQADSSDDTRTYTCRSQASRNSGLNDVSWSGALSEDQSNRGCPVLSFSLPCLCCLDVFALSC